MQHRMFRSWTRRCTSLPPKSARMRTKSRWCAKSGGLAKAGRPCKDPGRGAAFRCHRGPHECGQSQGGCAKKRRPCTSRSACNFPLKLPVQQAAPVPLTMRSSAERDHCCLHCSWAAADKSICGRPRRALGRAGGSAMLGGFAGSDCSFMGAKK